MKSAFIIAIVAVAMIGVVIPSVFADINYPTNTHRVDKPPSYCAVIPSDTSDLPRLAIFAWENEVEESVDDWRTKLQNGLPANAKPLWHMSYLGSGTEPLPKCDYPIYLKPFSDNYEERFDSHGIFTWSSLVYHIEIYFLKILNQHPFYDFDLLRTDSEIGGTIRHEIGHSLGLSHYSTDDDALMEKWNKHYDEFYREGQITSHPSIMLGGFGTDKDLRPITALDISKVRSIYGTAAGFYAFSTVPAPQPTVPTPQPTVPTSQIVLPLEPIFPIENMGIDSNEIIIDSYSTQYLKISGDISEDVFKKGHKLYLTIKSPDLTEKLLTITTTSNGHFETILSFDHNDLVGFYKISASYLGHVDESKDVKFKIISKETSVQSKSQITNQQSSSLTNDDYDGDGITDNRDSCQYDAETFNGFQDTDGCPDKLPNPVQTIPSLSITANVLEGSETIEITGKTSRIRCACGQDVVMLNVVAPNGNLISVDQIYPYANGSFTTDISVGGSLWSQDGAYTVTAQQESGLTKVGHYSNFIDSMEVDIEDGLVVPACGSNEVAIHDTCTPYTITGGDISSATINTNDNSIILNINADDMGVLVFVPSTSTQKGIFMVLVDGEESDDAEINGNTVIVPFGAGSKQIEIVGTYVVPEFGTIAAMILAVAIISIVAISAKSRLSIVPRY